MRILFLFFLLMFTLLNAKTISPNEVYSEVIQIQKEVTLLKEHFKINKITAVVPINTKLKPRHTWQKTYEIFLKINMLRSKFELPIVEPINLEPVLRLDPALTYEQIQRLLTEIRIFKLRMDIDKQITPKQTYTNKTPEDVFNALNQISYDITLVTQEEISPSNVFGESIRIYKDLTAIIEYLSIEDKTIPTIRKENATPTDSFAVAMKIIEKIKQLQNQVGIESTDFYAFKQNEIKPHNVLEMTQMIIAELQTIKAFLGLTNYITPAAKAYANKTPSDVEQMMGWCLVKISLINDFVSQARAQR